MATYLIDGGVVTPNKPCCIISLPALKPQLQRRSVTLLPQPTKIKVRAISTKYGWCSVRACRDKSQSYDYWKHVVDTIDSRGQRVTIADVMSSKDNLHLNRTQKALQALAEDTNGSVKVWDEGGVLYVFPQGRKLKIVSLLETLLKKLKIKSLLEFVLKVATFSVRASFGVSLFVTSFLGLPISILLLLIRVICEADGCEDGRVIQSLGRLCGGWRIIEYVSSVVFGDGDDPNRWIEEKKWKMIGVYIALSGGVVTAEEIAPYLDPKTNVKMDDDGSYMFPVLLRFGGYPEVDEEGNILYHFPAVYCTPTKTSRGNKFVGRWADQDFEVDKFLKEAQWKLSFDDKENKFVKYVLRYHLVLAIIHTILWRSKENSSDALISNTACFFTLFVVFVEIIQFIRRSSIQQKNAEIVERNKLREELAKALGLPNDSLKRTLLSARDMARRKFIANDLMDDGQKRQDWDRRFKEVIDVK